MVHRLLAIFSRAVDRLFPSPTASNPAPLLVVAQPPTASPHSSLKDIPPFPTSNFTDSAVHLFFGQQIFWRKLLISCLLVLLNCAPILASTHTQATPDSQASKQDVVLLQPAMMTPQELTKMQAQISAQDDLSPQKARIQTPSQTGEKGALNPTMARLAPVSNQRQSHNIYKSTSKPPLVPPQNPLSSLPNASENKADQPIEPRNIPVLHPQDLTKEGAHELVQREGSGPKLPLISAPLATSPTQTRSGDDSPSDLPKPWAQISPQDPLSGAVMQAAQEALELQNRLFKTANQSRTSKKETSQTTEGLNPPGGRVGTRSHQLQPPLSSASLVQENQGGLAPISPETTPYRGRSAALQPPYQPDQTGQKSPATLSFASPIFRDSNAKVILEKPSQETDDPEDEEGGQEPEPETKPLTDTLKYLPKHSSKDGTRHSLKQAPKNGSQAPTTDLSKKAAASKKASKKSLANDLADPHRTSQRPPSGKTPPSSPDLPLENATAKLQLTTLQTDLAALQTRIGQALKSLEVQPSGPRLGADTTLNSFLVQHIDRFGLYLKYRAQELLHGLRTISQSILMPPPPSPLFGRYALGLLAGALVGAGLVVGLRWTLLGRLKSLMSANNQPVLMQISLISSFLFLPLSLAFLMAVITGMSMALLGVSVSPMWRLNACALVPLHTYLCWACHTWTNLLFSPGQDRASLIPIPPQTSIGVSFRIHLGIGWYGLCMGALVLAELFALDSAVMHALLDGCVLGVGLCLWSALALVRAHLTPTREHRALIRLMYGLRVCVWGLCLFWLLGKQVAMTLIIPFLETLFVLMGAKLLGYSLERVRRRLLWIWRRQKGWLRSVTAQKTILTRTLRYGAYGLMLGIWGPRLWPSASGENLLWSGLISPLLSPSLLRSGLNASLVFLGANFLTKASDRILRYYVEEKYTSDTLENNFLSSRLKTLMAMLKTVLRIVIWVPAISIILSIILAQFGENISVTPWISSIGAASFGLTFGVQNIVRDFITGFFIILENNMMVGDEVQIDAYSGKVETITIRTLKIRTDTGTLLTIPFGAISVIGNKNRDFSATVLNISVGYEEDSEKVQTLIEKAFIMLKKTPYFGRQILGSMEMRGIAEVTGFSMVFQVKIKTLPNVQDTVKRAFTRHLKTLFDEAGIKVPNPAYPVPRAMPSLTQTSL